MKPLNVEAAYVRWLRDGPDHAGIQVGTRVPVTRPSSFVVLSRAGGGRRNLVQSDPRILIECWGDSDSSAWALTEATWERMEASDGKTLAFSVWVSQIELTEPVNYPDDDTSSPRYQFIATPTVAYSEEP